MFVAARVEVTLMRRSGLLNGLQRGRMNQPARFGGDGRFEPSELGPVHKAMPIKEK
jgi:hypothetical protein